MGASCGCGLMGLFGADHEEDVAPKGSASTLEAYALEVEFVTSGVKVVDVTREVPAVDILDDKEAIRF